jgi:hypothetical protein
MYGTLLMLTFVIPELEIMTVIALDKNEEYM